MKKPIPFGKYYLLERINVGGMAEVFRAKAYGVEGFERLVAVKRILPNIAEDHDFITMFVDEAKIAVQLNHANIAQVFDLGVVEGSYYIALEHVHGRDLRAIFERCRQRGGPMPIPETLYVIMKVCEALDYAHNKRDPAGRELHLVHRDVSPQNVLVSFEGEVKIIDFGIAKAAGKVGRTQAGILKGKFGYVSPEQVRGLPVDRRSDVFSVGVVLYEMLTGERLFTGESDFETLEKVRNVELLPPSTINRAIADELEAIVLKALAKDVEDRYEHAIDLHDELQAFVYSAGLFCSRKDVAAWMKDVFAREIDDEGRKLEQYRQLAPAPAAAAAPASPRPSLGHGVDRSSGVVAAAEAPAVAALNGVGHARARTGDPFAAAGLAGAVSPRHVVTAPVTRQPPAAVASARPVAAAARPTRDWEEEVETQIYEPGGPRERRPTGLVGPAAASFAPASAPAAAVPVVSTERPVSAPVVLEPPVLPAPRRASAYAAAPASPFGGTNGRPVAATEAPSGSVATSTPPRAEVPRGTVVPQIRERKAVGRGRVAWAVAGAAVLVVGVAVGAYVVARGGRAAVPGAAPEARPAVVAADARTGFDIHTEPLGARVLLDGNDLGAAPLRVQSLVPGVHRLVVEPPPGAGEAFARHEQELRLAAGEFPVLSIKLPKADGVAAAPARTPDGAPAAATPPRADERSKASPPSRPVAEPKRAERPRREPTATRPQPARAGSESVSVARDSATASPDRPLVTKAAPATPRVTAPGRLRAGRDGSGARPRPDPTPRGASAAVTGRLSLGAKPQCRIFIDGVDTGRTTPVRELEVPAGRVQVLLVNQEFGIREKFTVSVKRDETTKVIKDYSDRLP